VPDGHAGSLSPVHGVLHTSGSSAVARIHVRSRQSSSVAHAAPRAVGVGVGSWHCMPSALDSQVMPSGQSLVLWQARVQ
jgi:hypothetical protein